MSLRAWSLGRVSQASTVLFAHWWAAIWENLLNMLVQRLLLFLVDREHIQSEREGVSSCLSCHRDQRSHTQRQLGNPHLVSSEIENEHVSWTVGVIRGTGRPGAGHVPTSSTSPSLCSPSSNSSSFASIKFERRSLFSSLSSENLRSLIDSNKYDCPRQIDS